ncbi:MAG: DNA polymerase IV [Candidatus Woesearchaeota archaeon]
MRVYAYVDMDCFFAACEVKQKPWLFDKPLIIGSTTNRGVVSTANYHARAFGVHSAMPISQARALCKQGVFVKPQHRYYQQESQKIFSYLAQICDSYEARSIDEAILDITTLAQKKGWLGGAKYIRAFLFEKTGYTCSIGVANSSRVAKMASDHHKPSGITVVKNHQAFLHPLAIEKIPGIGKKSISHYQEKGVYTIGDLAKKDIFWVMEHFGKHAYKYWFLATGNDRTGMSPYKKEKSISHETTFDYDISCQKTLVQTLHSLFEKTVDCPVTYRTISIKIRYDDFTTTLKQCTILPAKSDSVKQILTKLFFDFWNLRPVRLLGVKISHLSHSCDQQQYLDSYMV